MKEKEELLKEIMEVMQLLGPALFQVAKLGLEAYESDGYLFL